MNFIKELFQGYPCALPDHLKGRLHNDWPPLLNRIPRSFSARGPRCPGQSCECGGKGYLPWPPKLVEGFDVTRWEWCDLEGNRKEVYISNFYKTRIDKEIYKSQWKTINLETGGIITIDLNDNWWPSVIPTKSEYGWLKLDPDFYCQWRTKPSWRKFYFRYGARPDFDFYYSMGPYGGRNPE